MVKTAEDPRSQAAPVAAGALAVDGARLLNALSAAMVLGLVPREPLGEDLTLTLATLAFGLSAAANHLAPQRLAPLTHVVKAAYTHLLFATVGVAPSSPAFLLPLAVSVADVLPLALRPGLPAVAAESLGAAARWLAVVYALSMVGFPPALVLAVAACSLVYFFERRRRIAEGRRHDYGALHSLEHLGVWLLLVSVNAQRLDLPLVWRLSLGGLVGVAAALVAAGAGVNLRARRAARDALPPWFDPRMKPYILEKSRQNAKSLRWHNYLFKPFVSSIQLRGVRWAHIEEMVDAVPINARVDVIVGVLSGGAFIAAYVAKRHGVDDVRYVRSRLWSQQTMLRAVLLSARYFLGQRLRSEVSFIDDDVDLTGKRVLVVDDSVCTGSTLKSVRELCLSRGAAEVQTFALFCNAKHPVEHRYMLSNTPIIWPWGWESD